MDEIEKNNGEIIIYRTEDGRTQLEVRLENENVWLSQQQMSKLFQTSRKIGKSTRLNSSHRL